MAILFDHLSNFGRGHYGEHSCEIILNMNNRFKDIFLTLVAMRHHLCKFGRGHYGKHACDFFFKFRLFTFFLDDQEMQKSQIVALAHLIHRARLRVCCCTLILLKCRIPQVPHIKVCDTCKA